ncbi:hypothetical protein HDV02_006609 [Globomyces sp. JEL0801]|nr:hypothetical protein HDV02_006609 [Globomyces sp. JEL0801]
MLIKETFVDIQTQNGLMRLLLIIPVTNIKNPKFPAILVFTEIYQITGPVKRFCARIASQGYIVACPESYHEFLPIGTVIPYDQIGTDLGNTLIEKHLHSYDNDVTSILNYLSTHPNCTGQFGATGMCLGGHLAFRAAFDPRIKSTVCFFATDIHSETLGKGKRSDSLKRSAEIKGELLMIFATAGVVLGTVVELALSQYGHEPWISVMAAWALFGIATKWLTVNYTFGITTLLCSIILLIQTLQLLFFKWKTSTLGISDSAAQCSQLPLAVHVFNDKQLTAEIDKQAESFVNQETLDDIQIDFDK